MRRPRENVLTMVAAIVGEIPRSMRCGAWCRLTPACTGNTRRVYAISNQRVEVRSAWVRVKVDLVRPGAMSRRSRQPRTGRGSIGLGARCPRAGARAGTTAELRRTRWR